MSYQKQEWANGPGGGTPVSAARLQHIEDGIEAAAAAGTPLAGAGVDLSGGSVSTAAVQAVLNAAADGDTVVVPAGATILLDGTLTISNRIRLTGSGTLSWVSGINNGPGISVLADGVHIDGVRAVCYTVTATSGPQSYAVLIEADDCAVEGSTFTNFQHGIAVRANGEWLRTRIADNHVLDITGAGGGPSDVTGVGEDRGDGITCWGAIATITGNVVTCKAGKDARIGIHAEGLPASEGTSPALADHMVAISGNTITGQFRRGIGIEDISNAALTGNVISDATWWGIGISSASAGMADSVSVTGNTIYWTRTSTDNQGSAYNPARVPIMVYGNVRNSAITSNTVQITATGVALAAVRADPAGGSTAATGLALTGNTVNIRTGGSCPRGFDLPNTTQVAVVGNTIVCTPAGAGDAGVRLPSATQSLVSGNQIIALTTNGSGILQDSTGSGTFVGNTIAGFAVGVSALNSTAGVVVSSNAINCATAIDTLGVTGSSAVTGNQFGSAVTTGFANRVNAVAYVRTAHIGLATPTGGQSGSILIANGKLWANDNGTWRSTVIA